MRSYTLAVLFAVALGASISAADWPQWRGPRGTGASDERNLPVRWTATENVAWTAAIGGLGVSSPIVTGDRVFVTSQIGTGIRRPGNHPRLAQGANAGVAGKIYFVSETGETIVVKAGRVAEVLARNDIGERLIASPAISSGQLFIRGDDRLFAIGKR